MKNVKVFSSAFILLSLFFTFTRCTPDTAGLVPSTEEVLVRNTWSVDYYFHTQDMTTSFSSSRLLFSTTGAVGYQKDGETIAGTWSRGIDASNNEMLTLQFNTMDANISRLNKSWKLTGRSAGSLQFEETDGTTNTLFRIKTQ